MPTNTTNFNLIKPGQDDFYDVSVPNANMDTIDGILKTLQDAVNSGATEQELAQIREELAAHLAEKATLTTTGHVQLNSSTSSTDETTAATPKAVKTVKDAIPALNNTVTSNSTVQAATANAVKIAYDKAVSVESAGLRLITGTYTGDGTKDRTIFIGATPKLVFVFQVITHVDESRMFVFNPVRGVMVRNPSNNIAGGYLHNMKTVTNGFFLSQTDYLNDPGGTYYYYALI